MAAILTPPKLYLDTRHLVDISRLRRGEKVSDKHRSAYKFIDECIRNRHFGLIFNNCAPLEWIEGKATRKSANAIAAVIDSAYLRYFFEGDSLVYTAEVISECLHVNPDLRLPTLPILQPMNEGEMIETALGVLVTQIPGYLDESILPPYLNSASEFPIRVPVPSAKQHVAETLRHKRENPDTHQERIAGYNAALTQDIDGADLLSAPARLRRVAWMKRFLRMDKILTTLNPGFDVDAILNAIDLTKCPALNLWFHARMKRIRAANPPKDNDVDDWFFLPVVPYADVVLTDSNFREFLLQADRTLSEKVFANPNDAATKLNEWL